METATEIQMHALFNKAYLFARGELLVCRPCLEEGRIIELEKVRDIGHEVPAPTNYTQPDFVVEATEYQCPYCKEYTMIWK